MIKDLLTIQMLPITIIIFAVQIFIQICCIKKVLKNDRLDKNKKIVWIVCIIVLQILGIIGYLLFTRKKSVKHVPENVGDEIEDNIKNIIFLCLFYVFEFLMLVIIYANQGNVKIIIMLAISTLILTGLHFFRHRMHKILQYILPFILVALVTYVNLISVTYEYRIAILITVAAIIIEYPLSFTKVFFLVPLLMFQGGSLVKTYVELGVITQNFLLEYVFKNTVTYMMIVAAFYFAKRQLVLNNYLQYLMRELKKKSQELEDASIINERNRIAREIHDTLGHTLTGAIIQLEVAKNLVNSSPEKAKETIIKTQDITRQGFNDVKRAIKALRPVMIEENTLEEGLKLLFNRMEKDYKFNVKDKICLPDKITDELKISVYRIVQELITNSMRHGNADSIDINIDCQFNMLRIDTKDNGVGCAEINEGNGLLGIRERVEKPGGHVEFSSSKNAGFGAIIYMPMDCK